MLFGENLVGIFSFEQFPKFCSLLYESDLKG